MKEYTLGSVCPCVREVGMQRRDSWRTSPRRIFDHEFLYCFLGNAHLSIHGHEYLICEGDVVIIPPDTPHSFWVEEQMTGELYWLHCDFEHREDNAWVYDYYNTPEKYALLFSDEMPERAHIRPSFVLEGGWTLPEKLAVPDDDEVDRIFRTMYKLYTRSDPHFAMQSKILMLKLLEILLRETGWYAASGNAEKRVSGEIGRYIQSNYYRRLNVREICECTRLNPDYAGKLFKKETGMSLIDYLNRVRLSKAKHLMLDGDLKLMDIADMVGFHDMRTFNTVSRKVTGLPPAKLRESMQAIRQQVKPPEKTEIPNDWEE